MGTVCAKYARASTQNNSTPDGPRELSFTNNILNRWRCVEVVALKKKFLLRCNATNCLDENTFISLFPRLHELHLHPDCYSSIFTAFDVNKRGFVDFRDFCRGLSLCVHGTRGEMLSLCFDMFADIAPSTKGTDDETVSKEPSDVRGAVASEGVVVANPIVDTTNKDKSPAVVRRRRRLSAIAFTRLCKFCVYSEADRKWEELTSVAAAAARGKGPGSTPRGKTSITYNQFLEFADSELDNRQLKSALKRFNILPGPEEERELLELTLGSSLTEMQGDAFVAVLDARWWRDWCEYVGVSCTFDASACLVLGLTSSHAQTTVNESILGPLRSGARRPDEIDGSAIQDPLDTLAVRRGLVGGWTADFVLVPILCWSALQSLYGGGPFIQRHVSFWASDRMRAMLDEGLAGMDAQNIRVTVELYPVILQGFWCNRSGHSEQLEGHLFAAPDISVNQLVERLLADTGLLDSASGSSSAVAGLRLSGPPLPLLNPQDVRVWILSSAQDGPTDVAGPSAGTTAEVAAGPGEEPDSRLRNEGGDVDGGECDSFAPPGSVISTSDVSPLDGRLDVPDWGLRYNIGAPSRIRYGMSSWWTLLSPEKQTRTIQGLGLQNGSRIMFETKRVDDVWPASRLLEPPDFHSFRLGDRIDAQDKSGVWHVAQSSSQSGRVSGVAAFTNSIVPGAKSYVSVRQVRVHFVSRAGRGDEVFDCLSHKLAPLGSYTVDPETIPQLEIVRLLESCCPASPLLQVLKNKRSSPQASPTNSHGAAILGSASAPSGTDMVRGPGTMRASATVSKRDTHELELSMLAAQKSAWRDSGKDLRSRSDSGSISVSALSRNMLSNAFASLPIHNMNANQGSSVRGTKQKVSVRLRAQQRSIIARNMSRLKCLPTSHPLKLVWSLGLPDCETSSEGVCGLVNLGNTCYFNSALQCLSHTPLLRHYFLSDRYLQDINKKNPLGTGGRLVQEFASLLRELWEGNVTYFKPVSFKKMLDTVKQQFAGNDQHDTQEFLAEMLDSLHEDVNKVVEKPYTPSPPDHIWDKMSVQEQGDDSWARHLARNQSVLVDLFQGQIRSEVSCPVCKHVSRTFDPFMFLSVPVPKQHVREIFVLVVRRMHRWRSTGFLEAHRSNRVVRRYCFVMPRLGDVLDLKSEIQKKCGLEPQHFQIALVKGGRLMRMLEDRDPLALVMLTPDANAAEGESEQCVAFEHTKNVVHIISLSGDRMSHRSGRGEGEAGDVASPGIKSARPTQNHDLYAGIMQAASGAGSNIISTSTTQNYADHREYDIGADPTEGDLVVDINRPAISFPRKLSEFTEGLRVDAIDHRGHWFSGSVVSVTLLDRHNHYARSGRESSISELLEGTDKTSADASHMRVHFDNFSPKWDETYYEEDIARGALMSVYTSSRRKLKIIEMYVIHRRPANPGGSGPHYLEVFGLPELLQVESFRSCEHSFRCIAEQALRHLPPAELELLLEADRMHRSRHPKSVLDSSLLPFTVNVFFQLKSTNESSQLHSTAAFMASSSGRGGYTECDENDEYGPPIEFPRDKERPVCNLYNSRLVVTVDWKAVPGALPYDDDPAYTEAMATLMAAERQAGHNTNTVTLRECLGAFTKEEELDEGAWYCGSCKVHQRGRMRSALYRLPDILVIHVKRFNMTARWREKIRTRVVFPLSSLDLFEFTSEAKMDTEKTLNTTTQPRGGRPPSADYSYDLYAVANHIGGMSGGHYTAFARLDGAQEEAAAQQDGHRWMCFDDDYVEEVTSSKVVSESAYVLFYRRRRLTPSNLINMSI